MKIATILKENKELEKYGMTDEMIIDLIGMENIADDQVEDMQYYIDRAHFELNAICAEAEAELGA